MQNYEKILLILCLLLTCACWHKETKEDWYLLYNSPKTGDDYIPFIEGASISDSQQNTISEVKGVEQMFPVYKFETNRVEITNAQEKHLGFVRVYQQDKFMKEYVYDPFGESENILTLLNVIGYPEESIFTEDMLTDHDSGVIQGAYLSNYAAKELGIFDLSQSYTLEIFTLIPATHENTTLTVQNHPSYVQVLGLGSQLFYPYTLKVEVAGILASDYDFGIVPIYIPTSQMDELITTYQLEEVPVKHYAIQLSDQRAMAKIEKDNLHLIKYPIHISQ